VTVGENDQQWIYGNYTCHASNAIGTAVSSVELRRARMLTVIEISIAFIGSVVCPQYSNQLFEQLYK